MMKNLYPNFDNRNGKARLLRISVIVAAVLVWILIDKGNVYGQNAAVVKTADKTSISPKTVDSPLFKKDEGSRGTDPIIGGDLENEFTIRPNPVQSELVFDFEFTVKEGVPVEVFDPLGKKLIVSYIQSGISSQKLDVSMLPVGMYLVRLQIGDKTTVRRIIKK